MDRNQSSNLEPFLPREAAQPLAEWLYANLRLGILNGRYLPGGRLPSSRRLASVYGVSRGVVVVTFEQMKAEGYLVSRTGSGTFVAPQVPDRLFEAGSGASPPRSEPPGRRFSRRNPDHIPVDHYDLGPIRAFRANRPALDLFPTTLWARVASRRLRLATPNLLSGCDPLGYPPLREAVAGYLTSSRGVVCRPEQVLIVSGVQAALDLTARLFVDPGDRVGVEDPGYPGSRSVFQLWGAAVCPVAVDAEGPLVEALPDELRVLAVTPAHQFPNGFTMSLARRLALVAWARKSGALIFEDDYDGEFRYSGRSIPAVQGLDPSGQVVFAGSFSKVLFPSLRLGYVVVPPDLVDRYAAVQAATQRHAPLIDQAVLADFIEAGHFGRHLRAMREVYAGRLSLLGQEVKAQLDGVIELSPVEAGLQTAAWLTVGHDTEAVARAGGSCQLELTPLSRFGSAGRPGFLLGFAAIDDTEIRRGVGQLARLLAGPGRNSSTFLFDPLAPISTQL